MEYQYQPERHQLEEHRQRQPQSNNYPTPPRSSSPKDYDSFAPEALPTPSETQSFIPPQPSYSKSNLEAYQNGTHRYSTQDQYSEYPPQKPVYYNELTEYHAKGLDTQEQYSTSTPPRKSSHNELIHYHAKDRDSQERGTQGQYSTSTTTRTPSYNIHTLGIEDEYRDPSTQPRRSSRQPSSLGIEDGHASTQSRKTSQPSSRPYSPLHRSRTPLTPYNSSRARPRPGFLKRVSTRCKTLIQWVISLGKRHPILFGLATFLPVMAIAVGVKVASNIGRLFSGSKKFSAGGMLMEHFADFKGLAGAKSELHGVLKVVHMYANHWCKVSPSPWPRTLSMLLEIFFMEHKKF